MHTAVTIDTLYEYKEIFVLQILVLASRHGLLLTIKSEIIIIVLIVLLLLLLSHLLSSFELVIILLALVVILAVSIATAFLPLRLQRLVLWLDSGAVVTADTDWYVRRSVVRCRCCHHLLTGAHLLLLLS